MKEENEAGLGSRTKTIYFYCDFRDSNKVSAAGVYGSLISQLLQAYWKDYLPEEFENFYQDNCQNPPLEVFLKQQLLTLVRTIGRTRIVVDALDECTPSARSDVLETLLEIRKTTSINLLVTSREEVDIKLLVAEAPRLCINAAVNSDDIEHFVIEECERNPNLRRKLKGLTKAEVIATISSKANGM